MIDVGDITINVTLDDTRVKRYKKIIVAKRNGNAAAAIIGVSRPTFDRVLRKESTLTEGQREKLDNFCDRIEGKQTD